MLWDFCIRRPVFTCMLMLGPVVLGLASYLRLGVELFPNVDVPVVVVTTTLKGASVDEMESAVTKPVEEAVNTVSGIDELRSTTKEGFSQLVVGFVLEKNGDVAAQEVRDKMGLVQSLLPVGTEPPKVEKFNLDAAPVVTLAVSGRRAGREVTEIARKLIKEDLEGVNGVGAVVLVGGEERAVNVSVDPTKLRGRGLTVEDVRRGLREQNLEAPGGKIDQGAREENFRIKSRFETPEAFKDLVVGTRAGYPVRLREVARVEEGIEEPRTRSRLDGAAAVSLIVQKKSGGNTVAVADAVKARLAKIKPTLPADIRVEVIRDQSKFIKGSIQEVKFHLVLAAVLVSGVLLLFIRDWRTTVIAALAVPTSMIGTFAFMDAMGFSLNNMTLLGMILAVGIVIDDAVVVLENVVRHMEDYGRSAWEAASAATTEIAPAVIATTLSLAVIFAPIAFMSGQVGRFFNSFGFVVGFAVMLSMAVSLTLTPMLCARLLKGSPRSRDPESAEGSASRTPRPALRSEDSASRLRHESGHRGFWAWVTRRYVGVLGWSLRHRWAVVVLAVGTFLSTPVLAKLVGTDFVPKDDQSEFEVAMTLPEGFTLDRAERTCGELETKLKALPGVTNVFATVGETNGRQAKGQGDVTVATIYCKMTDLTERPFTQKAVMKQARTVMADYPDIRAAVQEVKLFGSSAFKNVQLDLSLRGPDAEKLQAYADKVTRWMRANGHYTDVDTNAAARSPEVQVRVDRDKAADLGVNLQGLATAMGVLVGGEPVTKYKEGADQYDVWLRADLPGRDREAAVLALTVPGANGEPVELGNVARAEAERGPAAIERYNRQRQVGVQANLADGFALGAALPEVEAFVKSLEMPPEYRYEFLGEAKLMQDSNSNFAVAFLLAFVFMYMILAAQFESLVHPATILLAVPLTLPFALVSLLLLRTPLDIYAMIGLFMLFGIVKKNGILQVDYTNVLRAKGLPRDEAILKANEARLRPILMTTVMLVAAMIPIATGRGPGAGARASMAKVILGGQLLSLLLTLLVTPVAYSLWDDIAGRAKRVAGWVRRRTVGRKGPAVVGPRPAAEQAHPPARVGA